MVDASQIYERIPPTFLTTMSKRGLLSRLKLAALPADFFTTG
jgi:hypothetical protein